MYQVYYNDFDPFCQRVLRKNVDSGALPKGTIDGRDIRSVNPEQLRQYQAWHLYAGIGGFPLGIGQILQEQRILTAGWPCQPHSTQGKRLAGADSRDGWTDVARFISTIKPDYFIGENVPALLTSQQGNYFYTVLQDLAEAGYTTEWGIVSACAVGAPHSRERLFIVSYPYNKRCKKCEFATCLREVQGILPSGLYKENGSYWIHQPCPDFVVNGLSYGVDRHRLKAHGNSLVPQIVTLLARGIALYDKHSHSTTNNT